MADIEVIRPYIEKIAAQWVGREPKDLIVLDNGDIPMTYGSTIAYLRLLEREGFPVTARAYAVVAEGVVKSPELLEYLNDVNINIWSSRIFWVPTSDDLQTGNVVVADETPAEAMQVEELNHLLWAVGTLADGQDDIVVERFGGTKTIPDPPADSSEVPVEV